MDHKTYLDLTPAERKQRATLTPKERVAVDAFLAAAKALPASICIDIKKERGRSGRRSAVLDVSKRITRGSAHRVAELRKASLAF